MSLEESLLLAIADKLLIGLLLVIVGYWLNEALEQMKGRIALQNALAPARSESCTKLWSRTQKLTPRGDTYPSTDDCERAFTEIRDWYYSESGAMYLSHAATALVLKLLKSLELQDAVQSKATASSLRTQLKVDLGTYSKREVTASVVGAGNPYIEGTASGLRPPAAPHVKR